MATPHPTPTALKKLRGNPGKRALPKNEPTPDLMDCYVAPPDHLNDEAKLAYSDLIQQFGVAKMLTVVDNKALLLLCETWGEYRELKDQIDGDYTIEVAGSMGQTVVKANPLVAMMQKARADVLVLLREFGATPSSRAKVQTVDAVDKDDPLQAFLGSRN